MSNFYEEFKQRRIWRVLIVYPSIVFVLLQAVEFFINNYALDRRFLTAGIVAAVVLLPAALLWNWRHGEEGAQRFTRAEIGAYSVFGVAAIAAVSWYWSSTPVKPSQVSPDLSVVRSIVVMPFENAGDDTEVQYLCDGIAESLTNWLATVPGVKVISKSAAFRLRDDSGNVEKLVAVLGVDNVVRGRLEKRGDDIVISASLINANDESQLWGERMVQPLAKILDLERSIVTAIKEGLRLKVSDDAAMQTAAGGTDQPEAYQHYLRGHFLIQATDAQSINLGLEDLRAAISIDPQFALPYADISAAMLQKVFYAMQADETLRGEARNAAYTAVALAPELAEAHTALAMMHQAITFDWAAAEDAYEAAIRLSPRSPAPYIHYSEFLWSTLRFERALAMAERALEIDPRNGSAMHSIGIAYFYSGEFASAAITFEQWNRFYPGQRWSYVKHALALALDGQCQAAAIPAETVERLSQGDGSPLFETWLAWGYQACGRDDLYAISKARLEKFLAANPGSIDSGAAFYHLLEGNADGVIDILQRIVAARDPATIFSQAYVLDHMQWPAPGRLARDPRMRSILRDLDFPATQWSVPK